MNLFELFSQLEIPVCNGDETFNSTVVQQYDQFRIAVDCHSQPLILLKILENARRVPKNYRLRYIEVLHNADCKVYDKHGFLNEKYTIVKFLSTDRIMIKYFLAISEKLILSLGKNPNTENFYNALDVLIEIFRSLVEPAKKTIIGLWSELFLISNGRDPNTLLKYWHETHSDKFDFNSGDEKIEVKSTSKLERIHRFSAQQLFPSLNSRIYIISLYIKETDDGISVHDLIDKICKRIGNNLVLTEKLFTVTAATLGSSFESSFNFLIDEKLARESVKVYRQEDICQIQRIHIPSGVTDVSYLSDLSNIPEFVIENDLYMRKLIGSI